jgi:hypothetical protein
MCRIKSILFCLSGLGVSTLIKAYVGRPRRESSAPPATLRPSSPQTHTSTAYPIEGVSPFSPQSPARPAAYRCPPRTR